MAGLGRLQSQGSNEGPYGNIGAGWGQNTGSPQGAPMQAQSPIQPSGGFQGFAGGTPPWQSPSTAPNGQFAPAQNPPYQGVQGNPGYSSPAYPQLYGGFWNQLAQQMAGPSYASAPPTSSQLAGSNGGFNYYGSQSPAMSRANYGLPAYLQNFGAYGL